MKLDDLLKYFVPKETAFFPLFDEDAKILIKGSDLLKDLVSTTDLDDRDAFIARIKATEKEGDRLTTKIFEQLNKSFITPFDREDIQSLASSIDDVLDNINAASQRIRLYKPKFLTPEMVNVAEMIGLAANMDNRQIITMLQTGIVVNEIFSELFWCDGLPMTPTIFLYILDCLDDFTTILFTHYFTIDYRPRR